MMNRLLYDVYLYERKKEKDCYGAIKRTFMEKGKTKGSFKDYSSIYREQAQAQTQGGHTFAKDKIAVYLPGDTEISHGDGISIDGSGIFEVVGIRHYQNHIKITGKRCASIEE